MYGRWRRFSASRPVTPAKAGVQTFKRQARPKALNFYEDWIPACAGMTTTKCLRQPRRHDLDPRHAKCDGEHRLEPAPQLHMDAGDGAVREEQRIAVKDDGALQAHGADDQRQGHRRRVMRNAYRVEPKKRIALGLVSAAPAPSYKAWPRLVAAASVVLRSPRVSAERADFQASHRRYAAPV
jgi:hypothetical protein